MVSTKTVCLQQAIETSIEPGTGSGKEKTAGIETAEDIYVAQLRADIAEQPNGANGRVIAD